ncbi:MAG: hypothetical protein J0I68_13715 [Achromobacter sp.]|jgi:hypothetical protein|uniref:hypothetical protein n=1 Tax=Achromobacter TaxID=222 RepID=UPI0006BEC2A3|nr:MULTISPECIES: hypothetical protein [Achromobacter]MBN9639595.1 hypothetical protein [Achromobacter sp.]CUJ72189.1 Uncharacterised protein [Achromobacter sp. 2789STDY5608633]
MINHIDKSKGYLFSTHDLNAVIQHQLSAMRDEIEKLDPNRLLNTAPADLTNYFAQKYCLEPIQLHRDQWHAAEQETQIDVRHDPRRWIDDRSRPVYRPGQRIEVAVPFEGDSELFYCRSNKFTLNPPRAVVRGQELVLAFEFADDSAPDIRQDIDQQLNSISEHLNWGRVLVDGFNSELTRQAEQSIENRRNRLLVNQNRLASLGIPVKVRADAPKTYAVPSVRRKAAPTLPPATSTPFEPEPTWAMEHYEHALTVVQNMAALMERSPSAFAKQNEEHLRDQFLFQLNGQFEGRATGETFNLNGKTDILLRENGRNVFIAECKFWKGPKKFGETIDQLLGYTAWRDTKTAILVFNRGTDTSTVLNGIEEIAEKHPNYKRTLPWKHESGFRYIFHQPGDLNREFLLTVVVFHVPA